MTAYLFLFSIPAFFSFIDLNKNKSIQKKLLFFTGIFYIFFIGLRDEVGMDWFNYIRIYERINWRSFKDRFDISEPSYVFLNLLSEQAHTDIYGSNFIIAIIFVSGLFKLAQKMPNPWLAIVSVTPYLVIAIGMSGVRQAAAIGLIFHLIAGWGKNSFLKNIILITIATSFHYSAFVFLLFVIENMKINLQAKWILLLIISSISFMIFSQTDHYTYYEKNYIINDLVSPGALQHIALNATPALIYLIFIKKWNNIYGKNSLMFTLSFLSLLSVSGIFISSTGADRLALYLSPIQMLVYSTIPVVFKNQLNSVIIVGVHLIILYIWLHYSNNSIAFLPYKNILFKL